MRRLGYIILFIASCAGFTSCQKEITGVILLADSTGAGGGTIPPSTNGDLLIRAYGKVAGVNDTNVTVYSYNAAKKLIAMRSMTSLSGGSNTWNGYERNSAGLITRRKQYVVSGFTQFQADTAITDYYYSNDATPKINYSISVISVMGLSTKDSTVYTYSTNGKIAKTDHYTENFITGLYEQTMKDVFTYDASVNLTQYEQFLPVNGTLSSQSKTTFTYDSNTPSFLYTEAESLVIAEQPAASHNLISSKTVTTIAGTITITNSFNYNSAGKPATGKTIQDYNGTTITNFTYYYQ